MKKFELTAESKINIFGNKLFRIKALLDFSAVKSGELGGWIEKEENLDQSGAAWVYGAAEVSGDARVSGDAEVYGDARVYGDADILHITGLGTVHRTTTVFRTKNNSLKIKCGCFRGTPEEFVKQVKETRKGKVREEYLKFAELIDIYFGEDNENE